MTQLAVFKNANNQDWFFGKIVQPIGIKKYFQYMQNKTNRGDLHRFVSKRDKGRTAIHFS